MARTMSPAEVRQFALVGAKARLESLKAEEAGILAEFPELAGRGRSTARASRSAKRRRRHMSDEARKAVSERMTKYWAARRKAKGKAKS